MDESQQRARDADRVMHPALVAPGPDAAGQPIGAAGQQAGASGRAGMFDRRPPYHGDRRRAAVLRALDEFLRDGEFDSITIADISARAGVTRSAFYFYFENKAACVAALAAPMYQKAIAAADHLFATEVPPRRRIQEMISDLFAAWEGHQYLYRAMLEASRTSSALREMWDGYRESFVGPVAAMIDSERAAGRAAAGPDSTTLARMLLEFSDRALERLAPDDPLDTSRRAEVLVTIWFRTLYGATGEDQEAALSS